MSESRRVQRVQKELNQLIAQYIQLDWKGPHPGLLTVASVDLTPDLRSALVYVSVMLTGDWTLENAEEILEEQHGDIQRYISKNLRMKFSPKIKFKLGTYGDLNPGEAGEEL